MIEMRQNIKIVSKTASGFFAGHNIANQLLATETISSAIVPVVSGLALGYHEYCSHDSAYRPIFNLSNLIRFYRNSPDVILCLIAIPRLANLMQSNDISYGLAISAISIFIGLISDILVNELDERARLARNR